MELVSDTLLEGRVCIVTGAGRGIDAFGGLDVLVNKLLSQAAPRTTMADVADG